MDQTRCKTGKQGNKSCYKKVITIYSDSVFDIINYLNYPYYQLYCYHYY